MTFVTRPSRPGFIVAAAYALQAQAAKAEKKASLPKPATCTESQTSPLKTAKQARPIAGKTRKSKS